jgi:predicted PurR-regulated permease PerM
MSSPDSPVACSIACEAPWDFGLVIRELYLFCSEFIILDNLTYFLVNAGQSRATKQPGTPDIPVRHEQIFFAGLFAAIAVLAIVILWPFLTYIVLAGILTYALYPIYNFFRVRVPRADVASGLAIVVTLLIMVLPAIYLISGLVQQVSGAYASLKVQSVDTITAYLAEITGYRVGFEQIQRVLNSGIEQLRAWVLAIAPNIVGSIGELVLGLFIMFFVMYYGFIDGEAFVARLRELLPLEMKLKESLFHELRTITQAVLYGQVMTAIVQGTLGAFGLLIFGVSNWLFWGTIMMVTAFIPFVGTPVVWVPAAISLILEGATGRGIGLLIYSGTLVMNIDNFLRPRLVSGRTQVHPVLILIGVLGGLRVFGFVGLLVGPLILALLVAFIRFYEQAYLSPRISGSL